MAATLDRRRSSGGGGGSGRPSLSEKPPVATITNYGQWAIRDYHDECPSHCLRNSSLTAPDSGNQAATAASLLVANRELCARTIEASGPIAPFEVANRVPVLASVCFHCCCPGGGGGCWAHNSLSWRKRAKLKPARRKRMAIEQQQQQEQTNNDNDKSISCRCLSRGSQAKLAARCARTQRRKWPQPPSPPLEEIRIQSLLIIAALIFSLSLATRVSASLGEPPQSATLIDGQHHKTNDHHWLAGSLKGAPHELARRVKRDNQKGAAVDLTRIVAVSGQTIEFQCPLASELLVAASAGGPGDGRTITWRKDGHPLSQMNSTRVRLSQSGNSSSLTILQAQPKRDEGAYECALTGDEGADKPFFKSHQFLLKLLVPPRLASFEFPADAQVGMKVLITCSALEGQQPVSFVWLRDNQIIDPNGGVTASSSGRGSSGTQQSSSSNSSFSLVASLAQLHRQQLADKFALSAHANIHLGEKSEYVLIGGGGGGGGDKSTSNSGLDSEDPMLRDEGATNKATQQQPPSAQLWDSAIRIRQADDYSILSIEPLELKHSGRYTCSAQNEAARVAHSSQLVINAPPTFTIEPKDGDLVSGQSTVIECAASGQPRPTISWLRARESNGKQWDFVPIYENLRYTILSNGSLAINNVTQREQGFYMCSAKNGFGPELTKLIKITVHEPARISTKYKLVEARIEERAQMSCVANGEPPFTLTWLDKEGKPIDKTDKRFIIDTGNPSIAKSPSSPTGEGTTIASNPSLVQTQDDLLLANKSESSLIIAKSTRADTGHYTCRASNKHGQDKMVVNLLVQDVPDKVAELKVTNVTAGTISLRWQLGFTGNSPVTSYLVQYQSDDPLDDLLMSVARGGSVNGQSSAPAPDPNWPATTTATSSGGGDFSPMRLYNHLFGRGSGIGSDQGDAKHEQEKQQVASGQHQQTNSIKAALEALNGLGSTLADLSITTADEAIDRTLVELTVEQTATNLIIKDLSPYCVYRLRLAGVNKIGLGEFSDWIRAKTEEAPPSGSALKISAAATGPNSIKLTWLPPDRRSWNGQLNRFQIGYRPIDSTFELNKSVEWSPPTLMQSIMLDADAKKQQLSGESKQVAPFRTGDSDSSNNSNNNSISTQNQASSPYALRQHLRQLLALQQRELVAHLTNLQRSTTYLVWIQAINSRGAGPQSHAISVKTLDDVPPSAPMLRIQSTTTQSITIAWSMLGNFVSPANQYSLFYRRVPPPPSIGGVGQQYPPLMSGRQNSTIRHLMTPLVVTDSSYAPIFSEPGPFMERTISNQQVMLHSVMNAHAHHQQPNSFANIDENPDLMTGKSSSGNNLFAHPSQQQQLYQQFVYTLDQLECGSIYELYMTTRNSVGKSEPSAVVTTRTLGEPPLAPANKNSLFARIGAQEVLLNLASWSTGGCPLSHVSVRHKQLPQPVAAATISHSDPGMGNSTSTKLPSFSVAWPVSTSVPASLLHAINQQQQQQQQQHNGGHAHQSLARGGPAGAQLHLVSNNQDNDQQQTEFSLKNLAPSTGYELEIVAHNAAGHTTAQYEFVTAGVNGSRSGYTRREGVYRLDLRGQPIETGEQQLPSSAFEPGGHLGGPSLSPQTPVTINQLAPLALTLLCFVCLIISTTFCYFRLTAGNFKRGDRRMSMDGMQSVCSGTINGGGGDHSKSILQGWSRGLNKASSSSRFSRDQQQQQRHSELIDDRTPCSTRTPPPPSDSPPESYQQHHHHYCQRDPAYAQHDQAAARQQLIGTTLNPKSAAGQSFSQSVSMKDFNLIPPLATAAATLNFKNTRNHQMMSQQQQQQYRHVATTLGRARLSADQTTLGPAYGNTTVGLLGQSGIYNQQTDSAAYGPASAGFANCQYVEGASGQKSLETSWTTTAAAATSANGQATNYAIPAGYQEQRTTDRLGPTTYTCDDVYGQGAIDACIQHLMSQQYHEQQSRNQQQYSQAGGRCSNVYGNNNEQMFHNDQSSANHTTEQTGLLSGQQQQQDQRLNNYSLTSVNPGAPTGFAGPAQSVIESSSSSSGIGVDSSLCHMDCASSSIGGGMTRATNQIHPAQINQDGGPTSNNYNPNNQISLESSCT